jgi:hypothetical protein
MSAVENLRRLAARRRSGMTWRQALTADHADDLELVDKFGLEAVMRVASIRYTEDDGEATS